MKKIITLIFGVLFLSSFAQFQENVPVKISQDISGSSFSNSKVVAVDSGFFITYYNEPEGFKMYIQFIDPMGNLVWDEPKVVTDYPQDSWISDYALVADNQFAYIFFSDIRNGSTDNDVFGYKFDSQGNSLWGEVGVELAVGDAEYDLEPRACVMNDGYIAVAWSRYSDQGQCVVAQRVSPDGIVSWDGGISNLSDDADRYKPRISPLSGGNILLAYIHQEGGMYGDRQIYADVIQPDGTSLWSEPVVVCANTGIGMGRDFNAASSKHGGAYFTWYGDPDFNNMNDVFAQYIDENGNLAFDPAGLNLGVNDAMNQTSVQFAGEDQMGNAVFAWHETNGSYTDNILKMQTIDMEGNLLQGSSGFEVLDEVSGVFGADYEFNRLYVYGTLTTNDHAAIITNNLNGNIAYADMGDSWEFVSGFSNGQFVATYENGDEVLAQNCTHDMQQGYEAVQSESHLYSLADLAEFKPDSTFYYHNINGDHTTLLNPVPMNIYQEVTILDTLADSLGNYKVKVMAADSSVKYYMYSLVGDDAESDVMYASNEGYGDGYVTIDNEDNIVEAMHWLCKVEDQLFFMDFDFSPGARFMFNGQWDPGYNVLNDSLLEVWILKSDELIIDLDFSIVNYEGELEDWTLRTIVDGGSVFENNFNGKIYPNPVTDVLNIESPELINNIELFDATGRTIDVHNFNTRNAAITVNQLQSGVYYLKIQTNESAGVAKFVKE